MGLDAVVFCDCVEKGRLRIPHPFPKLLYISENGSPEIRSQDPAKVERHDAWMETPPCKHDGMMLDGCYLGNASAIGFVRDLLGQVAKSPQRTYPVLWKKVIFDGTHTGDYLRMADVAKLREETKRMRTIDFAQIGLTAEELRFIRRFVADLTRLMRVSLKVAKPIAF